MRAVTLLSGGLDSAVSTTWAIEKGREVSALTVRYGQRHEREIESAKRVARKLGIVDHSIVSVEIGAWGGSALTDTKIPLPENRSFEEMERGIPVTYVPARNTLLLSLGLALAEVRGACEIWIGAHALDYSGYPDCRPEFFEAFEKVARLGTRVGVEGQPIRIVAPLLRMTKAQIVREGLRLGTPFEETWSCYRGGTRACGRCDSCRLRLKGFEEAGVRDPLLYEEG